MRSARIRLYAVLLAMVVFVGVAGVGSSQSAAPPQPTAVHTYSLAGLSPDPSGTPELRRIVDAQRWYQWAAANDAWNAAVTWNAAIAKQHEAAAAAAEHKATPPATQAPSVHAPTTHTSPHSAVTGGGGGAGGFFACIREHESSNNYAENTGNGYYGAYQFLIGTWNSTARNHAYELMPSGRYGRDLIGVRPDLAAPADQDQMALWLLHDAGRGQWSTSGYC